MRLGLILGTLFLAIACQNQKKQESYTPGMGTFMGSIQRHHEKLYFAGANNNWKLAAYELHEVEEGIEDAEKFHNNHKKLKGKTFKSMAVAVEASMKKVHHAIEKKDQWGFYDSYKTLTNSCNSCHQASDLGFIHIQVPTQPSFSNQRLTASEK